MKKYIIWFLFLLIAAFGIVQVFINIQANKNIKTLTDAANTLSAKLVNHEGFFATEFPSQVQDYNNKVNGITAPKK